MITRYPSGKTEEQIRKEASSQTIYKTIQMVEQRLDIKVPRVGNPTDNRDMMIEVIRQHMN